MFNKNLSSLRRLQNHLTALFVTAWALFLASCAHSPVAPLDQTSLYLSPAPASIAAENTPIFLIKQATQPFNKIGGPSAGTGSNNDLKIFVDPEKPTVFFETQVFNTKKGQYTNLIYRIHFQEVPLGWTSLNLTAGRNPGLLFIYTLDEAGTLILVTTVHTCGCYLAFFPTEAMPRQFLPRTWPTEPQSVYGYTLPSSLKIPREKSDSRIAFTLESETHRISDVTVTDSTTRQAIPHQVKTHLKPMLDLYYLPYQNKTVSFFETEGSRQGYVKNNTKILERLFISWWAFDLQVGEDKAYSSHDTSDTIFYTSLKFWARKASDLKNFPEFLDYWGWHL
ncbi:MAG: hypothetical protein KJ630_23945 [Proteobacteria bacterium]|nr:hypothetical protein [Pseudomonadota bacterium]